MEGEGLERVTDGSENSGTDSGAPTAAAPAQSPAQAAGAAVAAAVQAQENPPAIAPVATPTQETAPAIQPAPAEALPVEVAAPVEDVAPAPESHLAVAFQDAFAPDAIERTQAALRQTAEFDPQVYHNLQNAIYRNNPNAFRDIALKGLGVTPEKVGEFVSWVNSGGGQLASTTPPPFPTPDAQGLVVLPSGLGLDMSNPDDVERYENAKFRYDAQVERQQRQVEDAKRVEQDRIAGEKAQQQQEQQRVTEYYNGHLEHAGDVLDGLKFEITDPEEQSDFMLLVKGRLANSPELKKLNSEAEPYVRQGAGRSAQFQTEARKEIGKIIRSLVDRHNRAALAKNQLERAAASTDPVLPAGTKTITAETPPAPDSQPPKTVDDWRSRGMAGARGALQQAFPRS